MRIHFMWDILVLVEEFALPVLRSSYCATVIALVYNLLIKRLQRLSSSMISVSFFGLLAFV